MPGVAPPGPAMPVMDDREIDAGPFQRADRHRGRGLLADRAEGRKRRGLDAEHRALGVVGIGDEAAVDDVGGAGNVGQRAGDQAAGAGFGGGDRQLAHPAQIEQRAGEGAGVAAAHASLQPSLQGRRMVALAVAAMPSSRPVKPSRSLVVAFTATREMLTPVISAMRARMVSRSGPIFGRSQIIVTSRLAMRPPRAVTRSTAYFRNWSEAAPFHLRIAGRKVRADIAVGQRAEDGVDQRMQADIAVGMGEKAACVRHAHAADHQMIAVAEGVHVIAGAGPDVAELGGEAGFLADKIFGRGEFHVGRIAFKGRYRQSRPFRQRGIVGEIAAAVARGAAMGLEDDIETKRLRRLRDAQPRALGRRLDIAGCRRPA